MPSVVIAAHEEADVIGSCLASLTSGPGAERLHVVVVANGCRDETAAVAAGYPGVHVIELPEPGKARALNAGDQVAQGFPRVYLDADMTLTAREVLTLCGALTGGEPEAGKGEGPARRDGQARPLVAVPRRRLELDGRPWPVRAYYAVNVELPVWREALMGRGAIAVSEQGRRRFEAFPEVVADDLFLDSCFSAQERVVCPEVTTVVAAPPSTRELLHRLTRVRRGNTQLRRTAQQLGAPGAVRVSSRTAWLRHVVARRRASLPSAAVYVALTLAAELGSRRNPDSLAWGRGPSTRTVGAARGTAAGW